MNDKELKNLPKNWSECECLNCGNTWQAIENEHFNFTFCEVCFSSKIGGEYYKI